MFNYLLAGVGGQGTVLASRIIAQCAMNQGVNARTAETIGMAQRGGNVVSHVRIGEEVYSPLIPLKTADVIIGFEPGEAARCIDYLKAGGCVVVSNMAVKPVTDALSATNYDGGEMIQYLKAKASRVIVVDGARICDEAGSSKVLNLALLGAAIASGVLAYNQAEVESVIQDRIDPRFMELNLKALRLGAENIIE